MQDGLTLLADYLSKAEGSEKPGHKYKAREGSSGHYQYTYEQPGGGAPVLGQTASGQPIQAIQRGPHSVQEWGEVLVGKTTPGHEDQAPKTIEHDGKHWVRAGYNTDSNTVGYHEYQPQRHIMDPATGFAREAMSSDVKGVPGGVFQVSGLPQKAGGELPDEINDPHHGKLTVRGHNSDSGTTIYHKEIHNPGWNKPAAGQPGTSPANIPPAPAQQPGAVPPGGGQPPRPGSSPQAPLVGGAPKPPMAPPAAGQPPGKGPTPPQAPGAPQAQPGAQATPPKAPGTPPGMAPTQPPPPQRTVQPQAAVPAAPKPSVPPAAVAAPANPAQPANPGQPGMPPPTAGSGVPQPGKVPMKKKPFGKSMGLEALGDWLEKAGGPYIGPRGGKWADPEHKIPWQEKTAGKEKVSTDLQHGNHGPLVDLMHNQTYYKAHQAAVRSGQDFARAVHEGKGVGAIGQALQEKHTRNLDKVKSVVGKYGHEVRQAAMKGIGGAIDQYKEGLGSKESPKTETSGGGGESPKPQPKGVELRNESNRGDSDSAKRVYDRMKGEHEKMVQEYEDHSAKNPGSNLDDRIEHVRKQHSLAHMIAEGHGGLANQAEHAGLAEKAGSHKTEAKIWSGRSKTHERKHQELLKRKTPPRDEGPTQLKLFGKSLAGLSALDDYLQKADKIPGGLADKKDPKDFDSKAVKRGQKVEMEHTDDPSIAREIARDHLTEDKHYYEKLATMEAKKSDRPSDVESQIEALFERSPTPDDSEVHALASKLGIEVDDLEEKIYAIAGKHMEKCGMQKADLTPQKARQILHDKTVHGHPITEQQRKYFGAVASGSARKSEMDKALPAEGAEGGHKTAPKEYREGGATGKKDYADPANFKYPIDTEEHTRAAISYFSKPKNAGVYSTSEQKAVWGRIRRAAKRFGIQVGEQSGPPSVEKSMTMQTGLEALSDYLSKSLEDPMPDDKCELGYDKSQEFGGSPDGGNLDGKGAGKDMSGRVGDAHGGGGGEAADVGGKPSVAKEKLNEEERDPEKQMSPGKTALEEEVREKSLTPAGQRAMVAREHALKVQELTKSDDVQVGTPDHPYLLSSLGDVDTATEALTKSEFYHGHSPTLTPPGTVMRQHVMCKSEACGTSYPAMFTACPECGCGSTVSRLLPNSGYIGGGGDTTLEKSSCDPILRPRPTEDDVQVGEPENPVVYRIRR